MVVRWLVVLVCLAGCDRLFGLIPVDEPSDAAVGTDDSTVKECLATYDLDVVGATTKYRYSGTATSWQKAEMFCETDVPGRTHLLVLSGEPERGPVYAALVSRSITGSVWIGLTDRVIENQFLWVTREMVGMPERQSPPWAANQPDNNAASPGEDCVRIVGSNAGGPDTSLFDDAQCGASFGFVCECDDFAPAPANF